MSIAVQLPPNDFGGTPTLDDILNGMSRKRVEDDPMVVWDRGVFVNELVKQGILLKTSDDGTANGKLDATTGLEKGTFRGTQMALTELYSLLEEASVPSHT